MAMKIGSVGSRVVATLVAAIASEATALACFTPLEWQHKPVAFVRDKNRNGLEDSLDKLAQGDPTKTVWVVADLTRCAAPADMSSLARYGRILKRGRYVTFVALEVTAGQLTALAADPIVAVVEQMHGFGANLDVSGAAIKVRHSTLYPNNLEDVAPTIRGAGQTVAVIDSGVDDQAGAGVTHDSLPASKFVGGYTTVTHSLANPDDGNQHGTHVAGIAVGTGGGPGTFRGVAPDAGLVDCQTTLMCGPPSWLDVIECFEQIINNDATWGVDVVNLSLRQCDSGGATITTDGTDAASMLANQLVSRGINVVAAAGNDGPGNVGLTSPCAADDAICVAAMGDAGTIDRADDAIANFSSRGPRAGDGDLDGSDETKPDVSAPGVAINSALFNTVSSYQNLSGTSMASPHVAGAAALIRQAKPGINAGSVKNLLIATAEDRGPIGWDAANGHGYIDLFQAISAVASADPGYPNFGTYPQPWLCSDVTTATAPQVGVPNTVIAQVRNNSGVAANNVYVTFGVYIFSTGIPQFFSIGGQTLNIPPLTTVSVSHPWTPQPSPTADPHACLKTEINYGFDTNFANNICQRNITINQTNSPVHFTFEVQNLLPEKATVKLIPAAVEKFPDELKGTDDYKLLPGERIYAPKRWTNTITRDAIDFGPDDCPVNVTLTLDLADDRQFTDGAVFEVPGLTVTPDGKEVVVDGVTVYGHPPCPKDWGGDADRDGICDSFDNCPKLVNPEQIDRDGDGVGDLCQDSRNPKRAITADTCQQMGLQGLVRASRAYRFVDEARQQLLRTAASVVDNPKNEPTLGLLAGKLGDVELSLCRSNEDQAIARLQALRSHLYVLEQVGAVTHEQARALKALAEEAERMVPKIIAATAPAAASGRTGGR